MDDLNEQSRGWRGSADLWLDAAYEALLGGGVEAVRVMPLAKRLDLSRTSFYWHFPDRQALLDALIDRWHRNNTGNLVRQTESYADTIAEAVYNVFDCWLKPDLFDSRLDFAIRNWSQTEPDIERRLNEADLTRIAALAAMFLRFGFTAGQSDIRARTMYLTQVGYISMKTTEGLAERVARMPDYIETFTGQRPTEAETVRFRARHNLPPLP